MEPFNLFRKFPLLVTLLVLGFLFSFLEKTCAETVSCLGTECGVIQNSMDCEQTPSMSPHCSLPLTVNGCFKSVGLCSEYGKSGSAPDSQVLSEGFSLLNTLGKPDVSGFGAALLALPPSPRSKYEMGTDSTFIEIDFSHLKLIPSILAKSSFRC